MSEQLLDLLKLGLLILLYLFFLRVMWAVFSELRAPAAPPPGAATATAGAPAAGAPPVADGARRAKRSGAKRSSRATPTVLRVVEPAASAGAEHAIASEMTIGRAPGCTIVVDDTYASQVHARVHIAEDGRPHVEDLGSTNGTYCNGDVLTGPRPLRRGDRLQIGNTVWELA